MKIRFICRKHDIDLTIDGETPEEEGPVSQVVLYHLGDKRYSFDHSYMWCEEGVVSNDGEINCIELWSVDLDLDL